MTTTEHLIDCDANPFIPDGWFVKEHKKGGQFTWDPTKVRTCFHPSPYYGSENYDKFRGWPVLNANVLDYLLLHPELIPEDWKGKAVFFWGTIYRCAGNDLVRCLYRKRDGVWSSHQQNLNWDDNWDGRTLAALSQS